MPEPGALALPSLPAPFVAPAESVARRFPLGVDVSPTAIRWAQLGTVRDQTVVTALGCSPVQGEPAAVLRQAATQYGLRGDVVLSLPLEEVSVRVLKMPSLPDGELAQAVRWQIEQTLPPTVSYDEFAVDFTVLQGIAGQWESRVLIVSAPRQRVTALVEHARAAGLSPVAVEIDPFALAACLITQRHVAPDDTILLLHLGSATASLSVIAKDQLAFSRSLLSTQDRFVQSVADHLRLPKAEALAAMQTHGLSASVEVAKAAAPGMSDEAQRVARALTSPLENLIVDVLHAFKSFSHQVTGSQIQQFDRVFLEGDVALLPGVREWLSVRLEVPVESLDPLGLAPLADPAAAAVWQPLSSQFAVAMALAWREVPIV